MKIDRIPLYQTLEEQRNSKLLIYYTSTRQGLETQIAKDVLPKFSNQLDNIGDTRKITLFLYQKVKLTTECKFDKKFLQRT